MPESRLNRVATLTSPASSTIQQSIQPPLSRVKKKICGAATRPRPSVSLFYFTLPSSLTSLASYCSDHYDILSSVSSIARARASGEGFGTHLRPVFSVYSNGNIRGQKDFYAQVGDKYWARPNDGRRAKQSRLFAFAQLEMGGSIRTDQRRNRESRFEETANRLQRRFAIDARFSLNRDSGNAESRPESRPGIVRESRTLTPLMEPEVDLCPYK